ncbi:hypothetical protein V2A60_010156 [Cordyceps javanica]
MIDYQGAESICGRAIDAWGAVYGSNHGEKPVLVSSPGAVCMTQGRLSEAEKLLVKALRGYEEVIAPMQSARAVFRRAREYYQPALDAYRAILGPENATVQGLQEGLRHLNRLMLEAGSDQGSAILYEESAKDEEEDR